VTRELNTPRPSPRSDERILPSTGTLYVVATPIGNLRDITLRALEVLKTAAVVAAEDTRHTRKLLTAHGIKTRLVSLHAHSSEAKVEELAERLRSGDDVAFVTDAGCPAVSDPGSQLVDAALRRGAPVRAVPGPSAVTAALSISGLQTADFRFLGFLPRAAGKRRAALGEAATAGCAIVVFEAPTRLRELLEDLALVVPERTIAVCRELTKIHEEILRGTPREVAERVTATVRGELTIVIEAARRGERRPDEIDPSATVERARQLRRQGMSTGQAAKMLSAEYGLSRSEAYQMILADEDDAR
jgi:16S rRNA (cytidine1402-2'-O)-methyltransferase